MLLTVLGSDGEPITGEDDTGVDEGGGVGLVGGGGTYFSTVRLGYEGEMK